MAFPDRLSGLILRDAWTSGPRGVLGALRAILTSKRITPDPDRQVRLWSGNARDLVDVNEGLAEIVSIYTPEKDQAPAEPASFEGAGIFDLHWETHNAAFSYSVPRFDVRPRLGEIKTPTLVVVGRHDPICPVEESEEIDRALPTSELVIFENSGHNPASDEPVAFQKTVTRFLGRLNV